jgi:multiple sugar transport system permease protein
MAATTSTSAAVLSRPGKGFPVTQVLRYTVLTLFAVLFVTPLIWMTTTSFKTTSQAYRFPPEIIPAPFTFAAYENLWTGAIPFNRFYVNTTIIVIFVEIGTILSCTMTAYAFARLQWWGRNTWFIVLLATMMLPFQVIMIPVYMIFRSLNWLDTWLPLIVPAFFGNPFFIFLLRQFFLGLPRDLEDAARVDGAGSLRILWQIFIPLSKPVLLTVAMFTFVGAWNDFLGPLLYLTSIDNMTVSVGLSMFIGRSGATNWPNMMAGATLALLPILILFLLFQKYFVKGIALTGMKG